MCEVYFTYNDLEKLIEETQIKLDKNFRKGQLKKKVLLGLFMDKLYLERYERYMKMKRVQNFRMRNLERIEANQILTEIDSLGLDILFGDMQNVHASSDSSERNAI